MSLTKALCAGVALLALATPALAQGAEPWDLRERNAYILDMQGKMWSTRMTTNAWTLAVKNARAVPRGTVLFMNNGRLYMTSRGMFDRAGNWMAGGA
ncbi:MAG: hypothetical protein WDO17_14815 [Alphaproteobacteria bacterium]